MFKLVNRNYLSTAAIAFLIFLCFLLLKSEAFDIMPGFDLFWCQVLLFPLVLVAVWRFSLKHFKIPSLVLFLATLFGAAGTVLAFTLGSNGSQSIHLAKFMGDEHGARSRIFREGINSRLTKLGSARVFRYWNEIKDRHAAQKLIQNQSNIQMLVWGDQNGLRLSFRGVKSSEVNVLPVNWPQEADLQLRMIHQIPIMGMSAEPSSDSQIYMALVTSAIAKGFNVSERRILANSSIVEAKLLEAASMHAAWHSSEPRGFAAWLLGNLYLKRALTELGSAKGHLECAEEAYKLAARFIYRDNNPELYAAIHNNYAILKLARRNLKIAPAKIKSIRKSFAAAFSSNGKSGHYQADNELLNIVGENYKLWEYQRKLQSPPRKRKQAYKKKLQLKKQKLHKRSFK